MDDFDRFLWKIFGKTVYTFCILRNSLFCFLSHNHPFIHSFSLTRAQVAKIEWRIKCEMFILFFVNAIHINKYFYCYFEQKMSWYDLHEFRLYKKYESAETNKKETLKLYERIHVCSACEERVGGGRGEGGGWEWWLSFRKTLPYHVSNGIKWIQVRYRISFPSFKMKCSIAYSRW